MERRGKGWRDGREAGRGVVLWKMRRRGECYIGERICC